MQADGCGLLPILIHKQLQGLKPAQRFRAWRQAEERGLRQTRVRWRSEQLYLLKNKKGRVLKL